jgi:hypothetical protein|tara:strand:- start:924 stop:1220 length:297 start_codon:yes stop_codon:yes gene_type:complete
MKMENDITQQELSDAVMGILKRRLQKDITSPLEELGLDENHPQEIIMDVEDFLQEHDIEPQFIPDTDIKKWRTPHNIIESYALAHIGVYNPDYDIENL